MFVIKPVVFQFFHLRLSTLSHLNVILQVMPLSNAEKQHNFRERKKRAAGSEWLQKERERQKKYRVPISQQSPSEQKLARDRNAEYNKKYREKKSATKPATQPATPKPSRKRRRISKALSQKNRLVEKLELKVKILERQNNKYR